MMDQELIATAEENIAREKRLGYLQMLPDAGPEEVGNLAHLRATRSEY